MLGTSVEICRGIPNVVKRGKKYLALLRADVSTPCCCQKRKVAMQALSSSELLSGC